MFGNRKVESSGKWNLRGERTFAEVAAAKKKEAEAPVDEEYEEGEFKPDECDKGNMNPSEEDSPAVNNEDVYGGIGGGENEEAISNFGGKVVGTEEHVGTPIVNDPAIEVTVVLDQKNISCGPAQLPPLGWFGPFPSNFGPSSGGIRTEKGADNIHFTGSRDERRRIVRRTSPCSASIPIKSLSASKTLDLNNSPSNNPLPGDSVSTCDERRPG
ncbi:hypothetical protein L2E82_45626 [Cichorium intybus]|uniref:Uncharacterized protein n=1 Tax=Cichorium intybus TaxID=13427 RepID=A0ACB8ZTJ2_CICIN|nr:hypothetical protein L2E82_45626 [Cichorium intybus]